MKSNDKLAAPNADKENLVSVIICNYNYERYIRQAINSALSQTYPNIELIIIDDGSTDDSRGIIEKYLKNHPEIRYYKQKNQGAIAARNRGLKLAKGELLVFLDSDDTMPNNYLHELYHTAVENRADVVYADLQCFGGSNQLLAADDFDLELLKYRNFINMAALIKKPAVKNMKFDTELGKRGLVFEDWDFFLNLAMNGAKITKATSTVLNYRIHGDSRNNNNPFRPQKLESLIYIIVKNAKKYNYSVEDVLKNLIRSFGAEASLFAELEKIIKYNEAEIENLKQQIADFKKSRSYRLGRLLLAPFRIFNKSKD
jgi:glycosyltransferase involved in cell wall biosynthesis